MNIPVKQREEDWEGSGEKRWQEAKGECNHWSKLIFILVITWTQWRDVVFRMMTVMHSCEPRQNVMKEKRMNETLEY